MKTIFFDVDIHFDFDAEQAQNALEKGAHYGHRRGKTLLGGSIVVGVHDVLLLVGHAGPRVYFFLPGFSSDAGSAVGSSVFLPTWMAVWTTDRQMFTKI